MTKNKYSWINTADGLFPDSPVGCGYSIPKSNGKIVGSDEEAAIDFYSFLLKFIDKYPEYKGRSVYIAGQSYGGHYVVKFTEYILDKNNSDINIQGMAVGDGWINPPVQMCSNPYYAKEHKLINNWQFIISSLGYEFASLMFKLHWHSAAETLVDLSSAVILTQNKTFDIYDIASNMTVLNFPIFHNFFNSPYVLAQLGAKVDKWEMMNVTIYRAFASSTGSLYANYQPLF